MSRELFRSANRSLLVRKYAPERLQAILKYMAEMPVIADVCRRAGISRASLIYYLAKSEKGRPGDGFDLPTGDLDDDGNPITRRFHELYVDARENGIDEIERVAVQISKGQYREVLTHKGRVIYKEDPKLVALGLTGMDCYLRDPETNEPVPETVLRLDTDMTRFMLKQTRPGVYGDHSTIDLIHSGGVLVVGVKKSEKELERDYGGKHEVQDVEFEDVTDDNTVDAAMSELE